MAKTIQTRRIRGLSKAYLNKDIAYQIGLHLKSVFKLDSILIGTTDQTENTDTFNALIEGCKDTGQHVRVCEDIPPVLFSYYTETQNTFGVILFNDGDQSRLKFYQNGLELFDQTLLKLTHALTEPVELSNDAKEVTVIDDETFTKNYQTQFQTMALEPINLSIAYVLPNKVNHDYIKDILDNICDEVYEAKDYLDLQRTVSTNKCDIGFYFDDFGERLTVIDHLAIEHHGDHILYLISKFYKDNDLLHKNTVVISNMINPGVLKAFKDLGIKTERVSHSEMHILDVMNKSNYTLAATREGLMVLNPLRNTSDALLSAVAIMLGLQQTKQTVNTLLKDVALYSESTLLYKDIEPSVIDHKVFKAKVKELQKKTALEGVFSVYYETDTQTLHAYLSHSDELTLQHYEQEFQAVLEKLNEFD